MTTEFVTLVDEKDDINRVQAGGSLTVVVLILVALTLYPNRPRCPARTLDCSVLYNTRRTVKRPAL